MITDALITLINQLLLLIPFESLSSFSTQIASAWTGITDYASYFAGFLAVPNIFFPFSTLINMSVVLVGFLAVYYSLAFFIHVYRLFRGN